MTGVVCESCGAPIRGMFDSDIVVLSKKKKSPGETMIVCRDRVACEGRIKEARAATLRELNECFTKKETNDQR